MSEYLSIYNGMHRGYCYEISKSSILFDDHFGFVKIDHKHTCYLMDTGRVSNSFRTNNGGYIITQKNGREYSIGIRWSKDDIDKFNNIKPRKTRWFEGCDEKKRITFIKKVIHDFIDQLIIYNEDYLSHKNIGDKIAIEVSIIGKTQGGDLLIMVGDGYVVVKDEYVIKNYLT